MERGFRLSPQGGTRQRTLAETAAAELHKMIMSGELAAGTHLRLVELAAALDMSAMPIREGLRRLEALGLVEIIPHRGAWVREVSLEDLDDTHATRLALETLAIRMAAERFTAEDADAAGEALREHVRLSGADDPIPARQAHTAFHFALYRACGSRWLPRAIEPVWENSERYRFATRSTPAGRDRIRAEHQAILQACVAHDPEAAAAALTTHLENAARRIRESMPARIAGPAVPEQR